METDETIISRVKINSLVFKPSLKILLFTSTVNYDLELSVL